MGFNKKVLKATNDAELLSYIINVNPELRAEIDLPAQGKSIAPIGKIIVSNERFKNAFLNTINMIGLTVIKRNGWDNPWAFANRGVLSMGMTVREMINDLCNVYDYNEKFDDKTFFLQTEVPNVLQYLHNVNFQKIYKTTTSDEQISMAFTTEGGLFDFIDDAISMLYESLKYDTYIVDKYMLCKRIVDGTITTIKIDNFANMDARQRVSFMKNISNLMTFRSPNYNPAGIRRATRFDDQILIMNTTFEADMSTQVLATSYFRNDAEFKTNMALIDGYDNHDSARLTELLGDGYIPFTEEELAQLKNVPAVIVGNEFFMDYDKELAIGSGNGTKETSFENATTLENHHILHAWKIFSTSPFENAVVFVTETPAVESITVNPSESSITAGQKIQLTATVETVGFANKSVKWEVTEQPGAQEGHPVTVTANGIVTIPADYEPTDTDVPNPIVITATSIFDSEVSETASITVL